MNWAFWWMKWILVGVKIRTINKLHDCTWAHYLHSKQNSSAWCFLLIVVITYLFIHLFICTIYRFELTYQHQFSVSYSVMIFTDRDGSEGGERFRWKVCKIEMCVVYVSDVWSFNGHKYALTRTLPTVNVLLLLLSPQPLHRDQFDRLLYAILSIVCSSIALFLAALLSLVPSYSFSCSKLFIHCNRRRKQFVFFLLLCHSHSSTLSHTTNSNKMKTMRHFTCVFFYRPLLKRIFSAFTVWHTISVSFWSSF